jgi:hypothetical protein
MTSTLEPGSYTRTTEQFILLGLLPTPFFLPPSIPTTAMTFVQDLATPDIPRKYGSHGYIYISFMLPYFSFFAFSVVHRDDHGFLDSYYTV